jgi:hypothetical protein
VHYERMPVAVVMGMDHSSALAKSVDKKKDTPQSHSPLLGGKGMWRCDENPGKRELHERAS